MRVPIRHRLLAVFGALIVGAVLGVAKPAPALADSYNGCAWPRVCFYKTAYEWNMATPSAAYKDVTSYYQDLSAAARGSDLVRNTRNDDRVWLRYMNNYSGEIFYDCWGPNTTIDFPDPNFTVTGIKIEWEESCP
jgi:hypothetical protein